MARKEKKYHFIYKTTNTVTGKYYIGMHSTHDLNDGYMGSGKRLRYSIRKYGKENHKREILEFFDTRQELAARERDVVNLDLLAKEECMNLREGGEGGLGYHSLSACTKGGYASGKVHKEKLKTDSEYRKKFVKQWALIVQQAHKAGKIRHDGTLGKAMSNETKSKISKSMKTKQEGERNSQFGTCWIRKGQETKKVKIDELDAWLNEGWLKGRNYKRLKQ